MKTKILTGAFAFLFIVAISAYAQSDPNIRQKNLQKRENVKSNRHERIDKRKPDGIGRVDDRVGRRSDRIDRKQGRTDKRVNRRKGN